MSGKAIIIIVVGIVVVSGIVLYNIEAGSIAITRNVDRFFSGRAAQNIAQSGVNMALRQLPITRTGERVFLQSICLAEKVSYRSVIRHGTARK